MPAISLPRSFLDRILVPLGVAGTGIAGTLRPRALANFDFRAYIASCRSIGIGSFPLISLGAIFISFAITLQVIFAAMKYGVDEVSGAFIAAGLLRELGPLTVGVAWAARIAALFAEEALQLPATPAMSDWQFAESFTLPRYAAAISMAFPLAVYGLVIGFVSATLTAAVFGGIPPNLFLESGRLGITNKDVMVYFLKLMWANPTAAIFSGAIYLRVTGDRGKHALSRTVTAAIITAYIANAIISNLFYAPRSHFQKFSEPDLQFSRPAHPFLGSG